MYVALIILPQKITFQDQKALRAAIEKLAELGQPIPEYVNLEEAEKYYNTLHEQAYVAILSNYPAVNINHVGVVNKEALLLDLAKCDSQLESFLTQNRGCFAFFIEKNSYAQTTFTISGASFTWKLVSSIYDFVPLYTYTSVTYTAPVAGPTPEKPYVSRKPKSDTMLDEIQKRLQDTPPPAEPVTVVKLPPPIDNVPAASSTIQLTEEAVVSELQKLYALILDKQNQGVELNEDDKKRISICVSEAMWYPKITDTMGEVNRVFAFVDKIDQEAQSTKAKSPSVISPPASPPGPSDFDWEKEVGVIAGTGTGYTSARDSVSKAVNVLPNHPVREEENTAEVLLKLQSDTDALAFFASNFHPSSSNLLVIDDLFPSFIMTLDKASAMPTIYEGGEYPKSLLAKAFKVKKAILDLLGESKTPVESKPAVILSPKEEDDICELFAGL